MMDTTFRALRTMCFGAGALATAILAGAQAVCAQASPSELVVRLERLENQLRQLTGMVEQLQYRNQQLEEQMRRMQPGQAAPPASPPRRSDVFDPNQNPAAPGAPRALGSLPTGPGGSAPGAVMSDEPAREPPYAGALGGRTAGAPLDLSTMAAQAGTESGTMPPAGQPPGAASGLLPPPPRNPSATGAPQQMVMAPSATPRDEYDLAYGYALRRDYALAEDSFRVFLKKYPGDRLAPEANYWLGETLFQRQRYREAAESFLAVSTKYETAGKAPDALLRLGQSLAALGEKEAACATFGELGRKYPRASLNVKQSVEREQKRVRC
jgi:tol-pal system protein YbgF